MPAKAFDYPDAFDSHQVHVHNASGGQPVHEQRLRIVHAQAVYDPVPVGIQARADGFGKVGME